MEQARKEERKDGRKEGRTFGNSPSRLSDPLPLPLTRARYRAIARSLSRPGRSGGAFGELHGHYALYLWHVCSLVLSRCYMDSALSPWPSLRVQHIREEVMQSYQVGGAGAGRDQLHFRAKCYRRTKHYITPLCKIVFTFKGEGELALLSFHSLPISPTFPNAAAVFFSDGGDGSRIVHG